MEVLYILGGVAVFGVGWYLDLLRRPNKDCPSCGGSEKDRRGSRWGTCRRCGGKGYVRRIGAPR